MSQSLNVKLLHEFMHALDVQDFEATAKFLDDTGKFTHKFLPASLQGLGKETRNREEYLEALKMLDGKFPEGFKINLLDLVDAGDTLVAHINTGGKLYNGTPYTNEYCVFVRFEDGKIISIREFVDSAYTLSQTKALYG